MAVHVDLVNSPYTQPPIAPHPPNHPGKKIIQENRRQIEESKRLQEFGQASKESWITRLYTHVHDKQQAERNKEDPNVWAHKTSTKTERSADENVTRSPKLPPLNRSTRPPHKTVSSNARSREFHGHNNQNHKEKDSIPINRPSTAGSTPRNTEPIVRKSNPQQSVSSNDPLVKKSSSSPQQQQQQHSNTKQQQQPKDKHLKPLPAELAFSPYLPDKERPNYKIIVNERIKELARAKRFYTSRDQLGSGRKNAAEHRAREQHSWLTRRHTNLYGANYMSAYSQYNTFGRSGDNPWRSSFPKAYSVGEMEKKAKETAEKAMRVRAETGGNLTPPSA